MQDLLDTKAAAPLIGVSPGTLENWRIKGSYGELAVERVWEEWLKWAQKSTVPSRGLHWLRDTGWLGHFPEVNALDGVPQEPEWHPEGNVFVHTCHCLDALVTLPAWLVFCSMRSVAARCALATASCA